MSVEKRVFICFSRRTPLGSFGGMLSAVAAPKLGAAVIKAVLDKANVPKQEIDEVIMGCVLSAGLGQAPARQAALAAGLPNSVQALSVNKVCSSGLKAVMLAAQAVAGGHAEAILAGGMENMSQAPYLLPSMRNGARLGHAAAEDSLIKDGLWDVYNDYHMGCAAELCAEKYSLTREMQDAFTLESYARANKAIAEGFFEDEIISVSVKSKKSEISCSVDEEPGRGKPEKIPTLKAVFKKDGTVTAANASSISDGAAAMLVCSEEFLKKHNLSPEVQILAQGWHAQEPEWFTTAPVGAIKHALKRASLKLKDIDLFEINEAFSAVALACSKELSVPSEILNIHGGAVALGHPIGASGARILTTLIHALKHRGLKKGAAGICNGGGEATALLVECV